MSLSSLINEQKETINFNIPSKCLNWGLMYNGTEGIANVTLKDKSNTRIGNNSVVWAEDLSREPPVFYTEQQINDHIQGIKRSFAEALPVEIENKCDLYYRKMALFELMLGGLFLKREVAVAVSVAAIKYGVAIKDVWTTFLSNVGEPLTELKYLNTLGYTRYLDSCYTEH